MPAPVRLLDANGRPIDEWGSQGAVVPHVVTFASIWNQFSKTYSYRWDEALRHLPTNALAMRRDCYNRSLLQERTMPTVNRKWQIVGEDQNDEVQKATGKALTSIVKQTPNLKRLLYYLIEGALWYGRYGSQVVWRQRKVLGQDRWCVIRHTPVNGDKIQFTWDGTPAVFINLTAAKEYPPDLILTTDRVPALKLAKDEWRRQFVFHRHLVDDADYFEGEMAGAVQGYGLRSIIYWCWWLRDEMLSWAVDFMKKLGANGILIFPYEAGNDLSKARAENNAKSAAHDVALTIPVVLDGRNSSALNPIHLPANTAGTDALTRMITDYFENHIERMIVGQSMSSGSDQQNSLGGTGRSDFAKDTKFQLLHFDADNAAESLTTDLLGPMMQLNFPQFDFRMRWEFMVEDPEQDKKATSVQTFAPLGVTFKMDEVRELTGMSKPEDGDETIGGQVAPTPDGQPGQDGNQPNEPNPNDDDDFDHGVQFKMNDTPELYEERWITVGGTEGSDGKKHGGSPVCIGKDGRITKGHPTLVGKHVGDIKGEAKKVGRAAENRQSKEHAKAKILTEARKAGIHPDHVHALASDIHDHHRRHAEEHNAILKHAREKAEKDSKRYDSLNGLSMRAARGDMDSDSLKGFDEIAQETAQYFPGHFADADAAADDLFAKLLEGNRETPSEEEAYRQALDVLLENQHAHQSKPAASDDEEIPF